MKLDYPENISQHILNRSKLSFYAMIWKNTVSEVLVPYTFANYVKLYNKWVADGPI